MAWESIVYALWVFLPAYVANMSPVFSAKLIPQWNAPIDGGRVDKKGLPILGPGKTWRGLAGGAVTGGLTALAVAFIAQHWGFVADWDYGLTGGAFTTCSAPSGNSPDNVASDCLHRGSSLAGIVAFGAWLGFMALVGDALKSYFKRRTGRKRGAPWVPFDQLDFVVFGVAAMFAGSFLLADGWLVAALTSHWLILTTLFVLTPLLHFLINVVGYWLKLKEVPW